MRYPMLVLLINHAKCGIMCKSMHKFTTCKGKKKVIQSRYRPGVAERVPGI
jgi:hypothetical protein